MTESTAGPNSSSSSDRNAGGMAADVLLLAFAYLLLVVGFKLLTATPSANVSNIWLANGFALGMLLTAPRRHWPPMLAAVAVAGMAGGFYLRAVPLQTVFIGLFNLVEVAVATLLLAPLVSSVRDLTRRAGFLRFLLIALVVAPLVFMALLLFFNYVTHQWYGYVVASRVLIAHALGLAVMTPVTLALRSGEFRRFLSPAVLPESLLSLAVVAGIAALVFYQSRVPLLFLVFPPLIWLAFRGGYAGTAVGVLLVVVVGSLAIGTGHGPLAMLGGQPQNASRPMLGDAFILLQLLVAALLVSLFPMIVALAEGRRAHRITGELQNRLRLLTEHSSDVILLTDLDGRRLYVSPAVREVLGYEPRDFVNLTWRDYVMDEDLMQIGAQLDDARQQKASRTLVFRARHGTGREIWIEAQMKHFRDPGFVLMQEELERGVLRNGGPDGDEGYVVSLRDITARRQAELALEGANVELASLVRKDSLTGLANRRHFDEVLREAWARALAGGWPIAVLMIDVDHFKQFNDCYGHQRGDVCLREVAAAIGDGLFHPDDLAARYGGEEFAVVLPRTSTDNAARVAERIRLTVLNMRRPHMTSPMGVVTVSVGVAAAFPVAKGNPEAVVKAADEALYLSKNEGRNRTTLLDVNWPAGSGTAER